MTMNNMKPMGKVITSLSSTGRENYEWFVKNANERKWSSF
jgi:hypothetical protein